MIMNDYDDFLFEDDDVITPEPPQQKEPEKIEEGEDLTSEVLRLKGILDPTKIKFEDQSGAVVERSWDSLSKEEQLNILTQPEEEALDLSDDEIDLLNKIRDTGLSVEQYFQQFENHEPTKVYKIDQLSDDEVYALDLLDKIGSDNITDEELTEAIEQAKKNETLYKKTVEGLRKEYIRLQEDEEQREEQRILVERQEVYNNFSNSIQNEIKNLTSFAGQSLELSNEDSENLAAYMLNLDNNGLSEFGKALQNPTLFTEAAFWLLNKDQIVEELTKQMQDTYKRGFEAGKKESGASKLIFSQKQKSQESFFDDDNWDE